MQQKSTTFNNDSSDTTAFLIIIADLTYWKDFKIPADLYEGCSGEHHRLFTRVFHINWCGMHHKD